MRHNRNNLANAEVHRVYICEKCDCEVLYVQKAIEKFKKKCPGCGKYGLHLKSGQMTGIDLAVDTKKSTTFGMMASRNSERKEKEKSLPPPTKQTPWWRKSKKIDFSILKNPSKYVKTGKK